MIDLGQSPQHGASAHDPRCPSCGVPESAGLGQHGADCAVVYPPAWPCGACGSDRPGCGLAECAPLTAPR